MTEQELQELEKLCEAATPGPWSASDCNVKDCWCGVVGCLPENFSEGKERDWIIGSGECRKSDCTFIAASRTAVPKLIEEVRRLKYENRRLEFTDNLELNNAIAQLSTLQAKLDEAEKELKRYTENNSWVIKDDFEELKSQLDIAVEALEQLSRGDKNLGILGSNERRIAFEALSKIKSVSDRETGEKR